MTPLNQWLRVEIESPNWKDTGDSAGSINFTKYQLKKILLHLRRYKGNKPPKTNKGSFYNGKMRPLNRLRRVDFFNMLCLNTKEEIG
jgi:hypothetical protein